MTSTQVTIILWALAAVCLLVLLYLAPMPANAQPACGDHDKIVAMLKAKYNEIKRAVAVTAGSALVEFFVAPSGTYTILMTTPDRRTCIVSAGDSWQDIEIKPDPGTGL